MTGNEKDVIERAKNCQLCRDELPCAPKPIIQATAQADIVIIGQAPGLRAHQTNQPFNDLSGDRLRSWLNLDRGTFYDASKIALLPMGFCYPGKGKSGDLPPKAICAPTWHRAILNAIAPKITVLVGQYAQRYYLQDKLSLTERVNQWRGYLPEYIVLPHPSPRNNIWLKRHRWFEDETIPAIRLHLQRYL